MQCYRMPCHSHCLMNKLHRLVYLTMKVLHVWVSKKMNLVSATQFFFNLPNTKNRTSSVFTSVMYGCHLYILTYHIACFINENAICMWNKRYQMWQMKIVVMWSKSNETKQRQKHMVALKCYENVVFSWKMHQQTAYWCWITLVNPKHNKVNQSVVLQLNHSLGM